MDFQITPEQKTLMESVQSFIDERVEPRMDEIEEANAIPAELLSEAGTLGLFGMSIPEAYGGSGLSRFSRTLIHQMIGRSGFGFAGAIASHTGIGSEGIVELGTESQKARYLPRMATGELTAACAITEPEAGSDVGGMRTHARKKGDR
jgi:acyl-CoA dehydrogenase